MMSDFITICLALAIGVWLGRKWERKEALAREVREHEKDRQAHYADASFINLFYPYDYHSLPPEANPGPKRP